MSGYSGGPSEGNGLDSLFAQLRQQGNRPVNLEPSHSYYNNNNSGFFAQPTQPQQPYAYQQPSVSSPIPTPQPGGPQPHHGSAFISPVETPQPRIASASSSNADRTSSLLNLLKFSQPSTSSPQQPAIGSQPPLPLSREQPSSYSGPDLVAQISASNHGRGGSSDLFATLMGNIQPKPAQQPSPLATATQPSFGGAANPPSADTQAYLLQLLNQPKPPQTDSTPQLKSAKVLTPPSKASSQDDLGELTQALEDATLDLNLMGSSATEDIPSFGKEENTKPAQGLFTYVNPFEQLAASSPRHRTPKNATPAPVSASSPAFQILKHPRHDLPDNKRKVEAGSSRSSPAHTKRKLEPESQESSAPPTPLPDGRTKLEALIGIGASGNKETVHDALSEVGGKVDKQVQQAIARAEHEESQAVIEQDLKDMLEAKTEKEFEETAQIAAQAIKKELEKEDMAGALDNLPADVAEVVKDIIDDTAQGHIADSWESADAEDSPVKEEEDECIVKVYNFPMKPWSIITILDKEPRPFFRDDSTSDIARLKKEFDQIDRTLVTASNNFIVYGMSKFGGVRIIRQTDGRDAKLFIDTNDRIFSVVASASTVDQKESIIATGISGTVYWALIKDGEGDNLEDNNPETHGFALPPIQAMDNESPGGVLKTRARKSSNHPEFFAVGRGKYIHIIWPSIIMKQPYLKDGKDRIVDIDGYLSKHSLKVNTGKAGKDFTFSEDDTTIVSLDKAGRVKFWDVRDLTKTDILGNPTHPTHIEIKEPLITFTTTHSNEKSWPTSVLFVDKLRPYQRGGALRYLIVGMKQNHTIQLWDLGLGKPVQEIHLPHSKESDAVCSILYHAATGMVVIGHPTRNSVYFLHLSAPKYNLPKNITQAEYMEKLVALDPSIPKPESTAVMSGMREYSFGNKGMLRSLDILQTANAGSVPLDPPVLFELYAMHSKGVTTLNITQADLGWNSENKVIHPVVAEKAGVISIDRLKEAVTPAEAAEPVAQVAPSPIPARVLPRPTAKETVVKKTAEKANHTEASASSSKADTKEISSGGLASANGPEKSEKKKRRKGTTETSTPGPSNLSQPSKTIVLDPMSHARNGNLSKGSTNASPEKNAAPQEFNDAALKTLETRVASDIRKILDESLSSLSKDIKDDRRTQAAVSDAKQEAILRLVSLTLTENVETSLGKIVSSNIQETLLPSISNVTVKAVNEQLGAKLSSHIAQNLPKELQRALPDAVGKALQQPQLLKLMSESLAKSVAFKVEEHFAVLLQKVVSPAFTNLAVQTSQRVAADVQRQASEQVAIIERQRHADSIKIEQLTQLVTGLTETVSSMAAAQSDFQGQFLRMQHQATVDKSQSNARRTDSVRSPVASTAVTGPVAKSAEEEEYDSMLATIEETIANGDFENGVIQWLQTQREQEFFRRYFSRFNPEFVRELSPLLLLSLGATISLDLEDEYVPQRIAWLEKILNTFQNHVNNSTCDGHVRELIPKIMGIYVSRVEHLFMRISQVSAHNPILKQLSQLVSMSNRVLETSRRVWADVPHA